MGAVQTLLMPFSTTATTALTTGSAASTWLAALHEAANRLLIGLDHFGGAYLHLVPLIAVGVEWIAVYPRLLRRADAIVSTKQYPLPANYGSRFWAISIHILAILTAAVKMRFAFVAGNAVLTTLLSLPQ
jgi:hypothetical protein